MTGRQIELAIGVAVDAEAAERNLRDLGDAAQAMAADVDAAADKAERASRSLDSVGDAADGVATNTSILAGAMGDIAGGLEGVGLDGFAAGLNALSTPLMFAAGLGDTLSVTLETVRGSALAAKAATIGNAIASKAAAVASKAYAAAQWVLNAALDANPIGLIVIAVAALIAGLVLAYKHSSKFRAIVQAVGTVGREAIGWVVDRLGDLIGGFGDLIGWVKDKVPAAFNAAKTGATRVLSAITAPIRALVGFVQDLIDKIKSIHWPEPPKWVKDVGGAIGKLFRVEATASGLVAARSGTVLPSSTNSPVTVVNLTVNGALDGDATARQIIGLLNQRGVRIGIS